MENLGVSSGFNVAPGDVVAGRYELHERLGAGGMGMVFRATDRELDGEVVALKLLLPHLVHDENVFRRFRNEVLVARALTHPNIVRTHDMGKAGDGYSYISMEFIDGHSLRDRLLASSEQSPNGQKLGKALPFEEALSVLYQIICGVSYAHGRGVIHRDLKPANVLLSLRNEVKLADFGTARMVGADTSLTQTGQVIGTPDYMSPEQIRGEELDVSCDIYALGILAFELVSGRRPFMADSAVAVAFKHLNEPLPTLVTPGSRVPVWFDEIVRKAAAKKKTDRFASVNDLAGAILDFAPQLSGQSTVFSVDRAGRQNVGGTVRASAVRGSDTGKTELDALGTGSGKDPSYEFGTPARAGEDLGGWKLGAVTFSDDDSHPYRSAPKPKRAAPLWVITTLLLAAVVALPARLHTGLNAKLRPILFPPDADTSVMSAVLGAALGVQPLEKTATIKIIRPPTKSGAAGVKLTDEQIERARLERELSGEPNEQKTNDAPNAAPSISPVGVSLGTVNTASSGSAATGTPSTGGEVTGQTAKNVDPAPHSSPGPVAAASSTPVPPVETPAPKPPVSEKITGMLALKESGVTLREASVSVDRLAHLTWSIELSGFDSKDDIPLEAKAREGLLVEVFDLRRGQVVATLKPEQFHSGKKGEGIARANGSFNALRSTQPSSGSFKVQASYKGNELAVKDLVLYRAHVTTTPGPQDEKINVVRGATATGSAGGTTFTLVEPSPGSGATAVPTGKPTPEATPRVAATAQPSATSMNGAGGQVIVQEDIITPPNGAGTTNPGLPKAKGHDQGMIPQPPPVETPGAQIQTEQPQAPSIQEQYSGTLIPNEEGAQQIAIDLKLDISGEKLTGSAVVSGIGELAVSGKVLARGMEIELRNDAYWFRLSSGVRSQMIRGRYTCPALQQNGRFEVRRR